jgi:large subunit ribosomal protein L16
MRRNFHVHFWIRDGIKILLTIDYNPKRTKFCKQHRGRMKGVSYHGNRICFGRFTLQALEPAWIKSGQIEARRRTVTRYARRGRKIWVRIFPTNLLQ